MTIGSTTASNVVARRGHICTLNQASQVRHSLSGTNQLSGDLTGWLQRLCCLSISEDLSLVLICSGCPCYPAALVDNLFVAMEPKWRALAARLVLQMPKHWNTQSVGQRRLTHSTGLVQLPYNVVSEGIGIIGRSCASTFLKLWLSFHDAFVSWEAYFAVALLGNANRLSATVEVSFYVNLR